MTPAEFEEPAYEAPLYNQLERGAANVYTPGRVLEQRLGFDRGIYVAETSVWETLGYSSPLAGASLASYDWPPWWGPSLPRRNLPRFRLNLFLQAKRSFYYIHRPHALSKFPEYSGPLWAFRTKEQQQRLLMLLASRTGRRAHVAYAAPVFHTNADLFRHTRLRSVVANSTFPSVRSLQDHEAWYYREPGATGVANPDPESIHEQPLLARLEALADEAPTSEGSDLMAFDELARNVFEAVSEIAELDDPVAAQYAAQ